MLPKQKQIEVPLLEAIVELGGEAKPSDVYPVVTRKFPILTSGDLTKTLAGGQNNWTNRIRWVRQNLVDEGELDGSTRGLWKITEKGKRRVGRKAVTTSKREKDFFDLYEEYEKSFRKKLLTRLQNMSPDEFEHFARRLLITYGFEEVKNTRVSKDGGIDGEGRLKIGLTYMDVAFQCKRWQGNVGRTEIDNFRGVCQARFEQGVFFTTSDFTQEAKDDSFRKGAVPIVLLNGQAIVDLMIEKGLGIERIPMYKYILKPEDFGEVKD